MARPHGFDHFCDYLKGLEKHYVIIGGGAASILMDDQGLEFRATKDVDLVVIARSKDLNTRVLAYVKDGGYNSKEATEKLPRYYRFKNPTKAECPKMIEIFARNELGLELDKDQHTVPITDSTAEKLSAILLDDEYFDLICKNVKISESGIPLINALANIYQHTRKRHQYSDWKTRTIARSTIQTSDGKNACKNYRRNDRAPKSFSIEGTTVMPVQIRIELVDGIAMA